MKTNLLLIYTLILTSLSIYAQNSNIGFDDEIKIYSCCDDIDLFNPTKSLMTDTIYCDRWDFASNEFESYSETVNTYDSKGRLTESKSGYYSSGNDFMYIYKKEYYYNVFDSLISFSYYLWNQTLNGGQWDNSQHIEYTYDNLNRLTIEETSYSPMGTPKWKKSSKIFYTYLQNGLPDETITQYWNSNENEWWNYLKNKYVYDQNNLLIEKYIDYSNNGEGTWTPSSRYLYVKASSRNQQQEIHQTYMGPKWMNNYKKTYTINKEGLSTEILKEYWNYNEMNWDTMFMEKDLYEYNESGKIADHIYKSSYIEWFNVTREMFEYDEYGNLLESNTYEWNHNEQYWDQNQKCITKSTSNILDVYSADFFEFKLYPNPTNGILNIELGNETTDDIKVLLINSSGQIIQEIGNTNNKRYVIDLSIYSYGTYFIDVEVEGITRVIKKVIFQ